jgi:thiol reductant ABC exporter CydD subunit
VRPLDPRLLRHARSTRTYLVVCVLLGLATTALVLAQSFLLAGAISDAFLDSATLADLRTPLALLALVVVARAGVAWAQESAAHAASARVRSQLRRRLFAHASRLGPVWLSGERSGELTTLATRGIDALEGYFARYLPQLVLACLVPWAVLAVVLPADLLAGLTVLLTLPLVPVFMVLVGLTTRRRTERQWRALQLLSGHFLDVVSGLPTLKVFGRAKAQADAVRATTERYRAATMGTLRLAFLSALVLELLATLSVALVAVGVGLRLVEGSLSLQTALLVLVLAPEAYLPLRQVGVHYHASAEGMAAAERVFAVLETPPVPSGPRTDVPDLRAASISVRDVTVRYDRRDDPALDHLMLDVRPGEVLAVTGPSGAGKSTLLAVLAGLVPPSEGRVTVGEVDLAELDRAAWWCHLTWLPQRPAFIAGSVADNVRLADPEATDEQVAQALVDAGAHFVETLPGGVHTRLGDGGAGLSAGQRQRVALARAFLRDAPLVLLDEPTAGLDAATEAEVVAALRRLAARRTVVVVAHRPALLALADRVVAVAEPAEVAA